MKLAIISGASRGIGRETAKTFAKEGYSLLLNCEKNIALLEELKTEIEGSSPKSQLAGRRVYDEKCTVDKLSPIEITLKEGSFSSAFLEGYFHAKETERVETDSLLQANLLEPFQLAQRMIPYLLRAKEGRILFSSSVWGNVGASMESLYSLTKGGINSFVKALGKELAPSHIAVNAVAFGAVDTDMNAWLTGEERKILEEEIPYGRMATVEEAAEFLLLLSKAPLYLTAQVIPFDGGWI